MLALTDPAWSRFQANYTDGTRVAELLTRRARRAATRLVWCAVPGAVPSVHSQPGRLTGGPASGPFGCPQCRDTRTELLVLLGACHTYAEPALLAAMEADIAGDWRWSAQEALPLLAELLAEPDRGSAELRYLLVAMAAIQGRPQLAAQIEALDGG